MYAYMLWADTTAGIMKMRNGANSAWISLWELDGTFIATDISLAAGSAAAPSLFFTGDTNTGLFSPGADTVALATAGSNRLHITSAGLVGIGSSSPGGLLEVKSADQNPNLYRLYNAYNAGASSWGVDFYRDTDSGNNLSVAEIKAVRTGGNTSDLKFGTSSTPGTVVERVRISSAGNVGVGTTSPTSPFVVSNGGAAGFEINPIGVASAPVLVSYNRSGSAYTQLTYDGAQHVFNISATEKARIDSSGRLLVGTSSDSGGALLQVNGDRVRIATAKTPASASDTGVAGEICWDANYVYVCTATNTWKRTAISTW